MSRSKETRQRKTSEWNWISKVSGERAEQGKQGTGRLLKGTEYHKYREHNSSVNPNKNDIRTEFHHAASSNDLTNPSKWYPNRIPVPHYSDLSKPKARCLILQWSAQTRRRREVSMKPKRVDMISELRPHGQRSWHTVGLNLVNRQTGVWTPHEYGTALRRDPTQKTKRK